MYIPYERRRYANNSSPKSEGMFIINKFAGGLNNTESAALINDDQSTDNLNMSFLSGENMNKRFGTSQLLDSEIIYDTEKKVIHNPLNGFDSTLLRPICQLLFELFLLEFYLKINISGIFATFPVICANLTQTAAKNTRPFPLFHRNSIFRACFFGDNLQRCPANKKFF